MKKATQARKFRRVAFKKMFPKKSSGNAGLNYRPLLITSLTKSPTRLL